MYPARKNDRLFFVIIFPLRFLAAVDAFVACGGNTDESGSADVSKIVKVVKTDFGLDVDIEGIIETLDVDGAGQLGFAQFKEMLTAS